MKYRVEDRRSDDRGRYHVVHDGWVRTTVVDASCADEFTALAIAKSFNIRDGEQQNDQA